MSSTVTAGGGNGKLREQALANVKRKRKFVGDVVAYLSVNGLLWLIWGLGDRSTGGVMPWPAWVSAIWGFLLALDGWRAYGRWPRSLYQPITDEDIERELERYGRR